MMFSSARLSLGKSPSLRSAWEMGVLVLVSRNRLFYNVLQQPGEGALRACDGGRAGIIHDSLVFGVCE